MGMEKKKSGNQKRKYEDSNNDGHSIKKAHTLNVLSWEVGDVSDWLLSKDFGTDVVAGFVGML